MINEEVDIPEDEECHGCGWAFADGGQRYAVVDVRRHWEEQSKSYALCLPCALASHSWGDGQALDDVRMHISQCTNLILAALENGRAG